MSATEARRLAEDLRNDPDLLEAFRSDPQVVLQSYDLTPEEKQKAQDTANDNGNGDGNDNEPLGGWQPPPT